MDCLQQCSQTVALKKSFNSDQVMINFTLVFALSSSSALILSGQIVDAINVFTVHRK